MIQPIVEGHGEVEAVPVLLRRLLTALEIYDVGIRAPIRRKRAEFLSEAPFRAVIRLASGKEGISAILVMFDLDDDCARDIVPKLLAWGRPEATPYPIAVALARREYEAWFLAALGSLAGKRSISTDALAPPDPEARRGAKEFLSRWMPKQRPYTETADQPALSALFEPSQAYRGASSFRKLVKELCRLLEELGCSPQIPPEWSIE